MINLKEWLGAGWYLESFGLVQARDNDGLDQGDSSEGVGNWFGSGYILNWSWQELMTD